MDHDSQIPRAGAAAGAVMTGAPSVTTTSDAKGGEKSAFLQTLEEIRDKGLQAYAEEQQAKKLAELRQKILESMGLTEQSLAALPPDQRAVVERMVDTEMQRRVAAFSLMSGDEEAASPAALIRATPNGLGAGLAMLQAMEMKFEQG